MLSSQLADKLAVRRFPSHLHLHQSFTEVYQSSLFPASLSRSMLDPTGDQLAARFKYRPYSFSVNRSAKQKRQA